MRDMYHSLDLLLEQTGNEGFDLIKLVEPVCSLRLARLAHQYRTMIPDFPSFGQHIDATFAQKQQDFGFNVRNSFENIFHETNVYMVLSYYWVFRHWGHPFIDYLEGLNKLHEQVTKETKIDKDYANVLASDMAFIVLESEFR